MLQIHVGIDKSLSEALIFASTNQQYDDRLFIELQVQYIKFTSSNLGRTCCVQKFFYTTCSPPSLSPDRPQVKRPPPSLQITSNFLVFMGFHMVPLLKRLVWLKFLYTGTPLIRRFLLGRISN